MDKRGDTDINEIVFCSSFSLRPFPKSPEEFKMGNFASLMFYLIPVIKEFDLALEGVKAAAKKVVGGPFVIAPNVMVHFFGQLPFRASYYMFTSLSEVPSMGYTNVPGPANGYDFGIAKVTKCTGIGPAGGNCCNTFSALSTGGIACFSLMSCKGYINDPEELMALFKTNLEKVMYDDRSKDGQNKKER